MNEKELFLKACNNNELKELFKGTNGYMIYPNDAKMFIEPKKPGTGNLMFHIFKNGVIPSCVENPNLSNKVVDAIYNMVSSSNIEDIYSGVLAFTTILENDFYKDMNLDSREFEDLLIFVKNAIKTNENILKNTMNFSGNISFYDEFNRINETMANGRSFL